MKKNGTKKPAKAKPNYALDGEDADMLAALENGDIGVVRSKDHAKMSRVAKQAAAQYFKKNARVSFRISETDLQNIKRMAASEGMPYQTFLTAVIHKLTTGTLVART